jgi:hypothetical protein
MKPLRAIEKFEQFAVSVALTARWRVDRSVYLAKPGPRLHNTRHA